MASGTAQALPVYQYEEAVERFKSALKLLSRLSETERPDGTGTKAYGGDYYRLGSARPATGRANVVSVYTEDRRSTMRFKTLPKRALNLRGDYMPTKAMAERMATMQSLLGRLNGDDAAPTDMENLIAFLSQEIADYDPADVPFGGLRLIQDVPQQYEGRNLPEGVCLQRTRPGPEAEQRLCRPFRPIASRAHRAKLKRRQASWTSRRQAVHPSCPANSSSEVNSSTRVVGAKRRNRSSRVRCLASLFGLTITRFCSGRCPTLIRNNASACMSVAGKE